MNVQEEIQVAIQHHARGRLGEAEAVYRRVLDQEPKNLDALNNLAVIFGQRGQIEEAVEFLQRVIAINPRHAPTHYNLGVAFEKLKRPQEAGAAYRKAVECQPAYPAAWNNLGILLAHEGRLEEAVATYQQALQYQPNHAEALTNLGNALMQLARPAEAIAACKRAVELMPNHPTAHFNLGLAMLLSGDLAHGWEEYEWRWQRDDFPSRHLPQLLWDGSDISGRTLLLHTEQGFGDAIQFVRYAPLLAAKGARVIVECQPELESLLRSVDGVKQVIARGKPLPYFDAHLPMLSLPRVFATTLETIPTQIPYLAPDGQRVENWRQRLATDGVVFRVGLTWAGKASHKNDSNRSLALEALAPLANLAGVTFYSLQKGEAASQISHAQTTLKMHDVAGDLNDFADTAALISNLDLVIPVDTAAAHLAGALGKPVWTLLPFAPDWRWLLDRDDSPWYPSMRLFRQRTAGDWPEVIERLRTALEQTVQSSGVK